LRLLSPRDRRLLGFSLAIQTATSLLDLAGVLLLGLVGALSVTVVQSQPPPDTVTALVDFIGLGALSGQQLIMVFAGTAAAVLLFKSLTSSYLTRRVFMFLANRQALVSGRLVKLLLERPLTFVLRRSSQETAFALIQGAGAATVTLLGQMSVAVSETALLIVLAGALLFFDPVVTLAAIVFFGVVAVALQWAMGDWAGRLGMASAEADISSLNAVQEALGAYREISVSNRRSNYIQRIQDLRWDAARVAANLAFIGMLPKYVFEAALVLGGLALAGFLFATQDAVAAVGTLALFLAAGSRVMPSLLRLQSAAIGMRGAAGSAAPTFRLASDLMSHTPRTTSDVGATFTHVKPAYMYPGFEPVVQVDNVTFAYPDSSEPALRDVSVRVDAGTSLALVGSSGAGKSTLADLVLGVLQPDSGTIRIGGQTPTEVVERWPGGVAYVPQEVLLASGSVRSNVALGLPQEFIDDERIWNVLERVHLADHVAKFPDQLETVLGDGGLKLSGGQRQRLGIARALYSDPRLLVLDEATSALDAETEAAISAAIASLEGDVTTILVAHRLSTVRHADVVLCLVGGAAVGLGTFDQVRVQVPELARQAELLGL